VNLLLLLNLVVVVVVTSTAWRCATSACCSVPSRPPSHGGRSHASFDAAESPVQPTVPTANSTNELKEPTVTSTALTVDAGRDSTLRSPHLRLVREVAPVDLDAAAVAVRALLVALGQDVASDPDPQVEKATPRGVRNGCLASRDN
jgi:hypothetical protein